MIMNKGVGQGVGSVASPPLSVVSLGGVGLEPGGIGVSSSAAATPAPFGRCKTGEFKKIVDGRRSLDEWSLCYTATLHITTSLNFGYHHIPLFLFSIKALN